MSLHAWLGDALVPAADAQVSVFDRGFRSGEGVFETVRAYKAHTFRLHAHLDRAEAGARELAFDLPARADLVHAVTEVARANLSEFDGADSAVRIIVTPGAIDPRSPLPGTPLGGPTVVVTSQPLAMDAAVYREGVEATAVPWSRELPHIKATSYLASVRARRVAAQQGAYEALLTDDRGRILEGSFSNVFAVVAGRLVTPPTSAGILAGVTRATVLEVAKGQEIPVDERPLTLDELATADEAFLTATTRELVPLVRVAGRRVGSGRPGRLTASLHEGYRDLVRLESGEL